MPSFQLFLSMSASKLISTPIRDLNLWPLAIPVQCSINWANEPTGSWSLLVYKWSINECEYIKIIYIWLRNEYESHIRSDGHINKSFFWSLAKTGKKIKCVNVPWFMSYRVKHSKRNSISTRSIYLDRSSNTVQGFWFIRVYPTLKVSQRFSVAAYNNKACAPSLNQTRRSDHTSIIVQTEIPSC